MNMAVAFSFFFFMKPWESFPPPATASRFVLVLSHHILLSVLSVLESVMTSLTHSLGWFFGCCALDSPTGRRRKPTAS